MAKYFKIQSLILCVCLVLSMFTGISAFAADPFELVSWDADGDFITLDFNQEIDTTNSVIELYQDDEPVEFTLAKNNSHSSTQSEASTRHTYLLTPVDGMVIDAVYELVLDEVKSSDGASTLPAESKLFTVAELANTASLKSITAATYSATNKFAYDSVTGNFVVDPYTKGSSNMTYWALAGALVGNDTTAEHYLPKTSAIKGSQNWTEKDYTVKVTVKETNLARLTVVMGIARSLDGVSNDSNATTDVTAIRTYDYTNMTGAHDSALYTVNGLSNRGTHAGTLETITRDKVENLDYEAGVEFKLASKDNVVHGFINGKKFMDAVTEVAPGHPFVAVHSNNYSDATAHTRIDLVDFQVTQCRAVYETSLDKDVVEPQDTVTVTMAEPVSDAVIKLVDAEGNEVENYEAVLSDDGLQATVSFSGLEYRGEYKIVFESAKAENGASISVKPCSIVAVDPPTEIYSFEVDGGAFEGTVTVAAVIANNTQAEDFTCTATVAIYDENGKMVAVNGEALVLTTGDSETIAVENFVCEDGMTYTAKCFVWDSLLGMNTIFEAVIE